MSDASNGFDCSGAPSVRFDPQTGEPLYPQAATPQQNWAAPNPVTPQPPKPEKKTGGLKTFFVAFLGAALACVLVLAGYSLFIAPDSTPSTSSGTSSASTSITVTGDDATLAQVVAEKCTPSVVCIYAYTQQSTHSLYGYAGNSSSTELTQSSLGSGVVLSEDGYVLTNYHVIEDAAALKVSVGGAEYDAEVTGTDESSDLAVIKLKNASGLTPIDLGDSDNLSIGEWVMSIGSPFGLEQSVATGIVSATSRSQIYSSEDGSSATTVYVNLIQTDAAINPGNSGGALVNAQGQLIGINTLITSYSGNYSGVGFAIPVNYAISVANQIIAGETPSHAQMGASLVSVTSALAERYNLPESSGAYISSVVADSGADQAGLEVGDIVTKFGDVTITSASDLMIEVRKCDPGDKVSVTFNRSGKTHTVELVLGSTASASSK